jgi:beta-galactosidase
VGRGGVLCLTAASGVVDEFNKSFDTPRPGPLAEMAGIEVSDLATLEKPFGVASDAVPGLDGAQASVMADEIHPAGAEVLAQYASGWRAGLPVLTRNRWGSGQVFYLGTVIEGEPLAALVDYLCAQAGVAAGLSTPAGVFAHERRGEKERLLFLLNENEQPQEVALPEGWKDALTGVTSRTVRLEGVDVRVFERSVS